MPLSRLFGTFAGEGSAARGSADTCQASGSAGSSSAHAAQEVAEEAAEEAAEGARTEEEAAGPAKAVLLAAAMRVLASVEAVEQEEQGEPQASISPGSPCTFPVPSLYLPCTFPVPSLYRPASPPDLPPLRCARRCARHRRTSRASGKGGGPRLKKKTT